MTTLAIWQSTRLRVLKLRLVDWDGFGGVCYLAIDPIEGSETPAKGCTPGEGAALFGNRPD